MCAIVHTISLIGFRHFNSEKFKRNEVKTKSLDEFFISPIRRRTLTFIHRKSRVKMTKIHHSEEQMKRKLKKKFPIERCMCDGGAQITHTYFELDFRRCSSVRREEMLLFTTENGEKKRKRGDGRASDREKESLEKVFHQFPHSFDTTPPAHAIYTKYNHTCVLYYIAESFSSMYVRAWWRFESGGGVIVRKHLSSF